MVYGAFRPIRLESARFRTDGLPDGLELIKVLKGSRNFPDFAFRDTWEEVAGHDFPGLLDQVRKAPEAYILQGTVQDPSTLDYLRDLVGLVTCLFDRGGIGIVDVLAYKWWDRTAFEHQLFHPRRPMPFQHISILQSLQPDGRVWLHTRGMRLFGRPDISIRDVGLQHFEQQVECINALIARFAEGEVLRDRTRLPDGRRLVLQGSLRDPAFHNHYFEVLR